MPSFWVEREDVGESQLVLRGDEAHHLHRVRRQQLGDLVEVVDGEGHFYLARLVELGRNEVVADIVECRREYGESELQLTLAPALIKGQRFDFVIEKATEVGVVAISPVLSERGVVKNNSEHKLERWQRLARAATKQCARSRCPQVQQPSAFAAVLQALDRSCDLLLMATPAVGGATLSRCLEGSGVKKVGLFIGPEGGFSPAEIERALAMGVHCFSWGSRVLRADTACVVLAALVLEHFD